MITKMDINKMTECLDERPSIAIVAPDHEDGEILSCVNVKSEEDVTLLAFVISELAKRSERRNDLINVILNSAAFILKGNPKYISKFIDQVTDEVH